MGGRLGSLEADPHERNHDVHVWKQPANLQYHDGFHALQGSYTRLDSHQSRVCEIRNGFEPCEIVGMQGGICLDAARSTWIGYLEGQFYGVVAVSFVILAV